jgi:hypothetical protein
MPVLFNNGEKFSLSEWGIVVSVFHLPPAASLIHTELQLSRFPNVAVSRVQYSRRRSPQPILKH